MGLKPKTKQPSKGPNPSLSSLSSPRKLEKSFTTKMADKPQPVKVNYCGVCGLPAEYCEFGPDFEKCKPWLIRNAPDVYPDLIKGLKNTHLFFIASLCTCRYLVCICVFLCCFLCNE